VRLDPHPRLEFTEENLDHVSSLVLEAVRQKGRNNNREANYDLFDIIKAALVVSHFELEPDVPMRVWNYIWQYHRDDLVALGYKSRY